MIELCVHVQPARKGEVMSNVTTIGIDLAKNTFSVHGIDAVGAVVLRKTVSRVRLFSGRATTYPARRERTMK